jgi:glutamyl/glutaminyl-tRNA synthetase
VYNTRINTTTNGALHLGHVYTALVNEAVSNETGGRFIVRFDDSNPAWVSVIGRDRMELIIKGQKEDMEWVGLRPSVWSNQSGIIDEVHKWISRRIGLLPDDNSPTTPGIIGGEGLVLYPLTPTLTAEKVVMDWMEGTNLLIRGIDLITEYSLYQYYCRVFGLPEPRHIYLPRLKWAYGEMSKSAGSQTVCELRNSGYTPRQVRDRLETACLVLPSNGWTLDNLKGSPRWS